jgi:hypothetical protein
MSQKRLTKAILQKADVQTQAELLNITPEALATAHYNYQAIFYAPLKDASRIALLQKATETTGNVEGGAE